jgi:hypothetical protein
VHPVPGRQLDPVVGRGVTPYITFHESDLDGDGPRQRQKESADGHAGRAPLRGRLLCEPPGGATGVGSTVVLVSVATGPSLIDIPWLLGVVGQRVRSGCRRAVARL